MLMVRKIVLSIFAVVATTAMVVAQNRQVSGTVKDSAGQPIVGATVVVDGSVVGATTSADGTFKLDAPANSSLVVSFIGYETQIIPLGNRTSIDIVLADDTQAIDDVVVVAFGTTTKEAFTGSVAVVNSEDIAKIQSTNVAQSLVGRVAGLQTASSSGDLSGTPSIRIRGISSINAGKEPLWVVDGVPYEGDLNNINPNDIESMTVLKDAASNALYGARGANGVIMVTTKKAKAGEAKVTFDAKWGVNSKALREYEVIKSPELYYETHYKYLYNYFADNYTPSKAYDMAAGGLTGNATGGLGYNIYTVPEGQYLIGRNGKLNPNATLGNVVSYQGEDYLLTPDDWMDEAYSNAFRQEYNVNIAGATERANFYASLGYLDNTGIIKSSELQRYTARLKAEYQAKKWLKVGANMSYAHFNSSNGNSSEGSSSSTANIFAFASQMAPIYPLFIRNADGSTKIDQYGLEMYDYGNKGNAGLVRPNLADSNAMQTSWLNKYKTEGNAFTANGFADFYIADGLQLTINGTTTVDETRILDMSNPYYGQFEEQGGSLYRYHVRDWTYNFQQLLTYNKSFGKHNMDLLLGHEYYRRQYYNLQAGKSRLFSYDTEELAGAVVDASSAYSYTTDYNNEGYFFRGQYNFDERIYGSVSFRRDASSKFHPDNRWGNFWSVGGSWIIDKESWFNAPWVDLLKVKASFGSQGNDGIGNYLYTDTYTVENNNGQVAVLFNDKGNKEITWETNTNLNVGAEFGFFGHRLSGSVEYFNRKTSDMLFRFTVPASLGYSGYYANVGDMSNSGIEFELSGDIVRTKNVTWNVSLNATHVKNKVTYLADEFKTDKQGGYSGYVDGNYFVAEGLPLYTYYIRDYAGVGEKGESLWYKDETDENGNVTGRTTTSVYTEGTRYLQEDTMPDLYGGFSTSLSFYGVDMSIAFTYQLGGKVYDSGYANFMASPYGSFVGSNFHKDLLNAWTPENTTSDIPRLQYGDQYTGSMSSRFLTDASYLNIQNINVGYTLPSSFTQKFGVSSLRLYLACDNVTYWSKRRGLDPRYSFSGSSNFANYSPIRTISGGVNIVF